ncbi:hypothetical protein [uncultured Methylobacterium sp.]|jgi:hypothetical protein|uniref:hypothetical protein n=1 Tax=uncultured Methylobacterium sp. TaxID=157278 RepID=UPI002619AF5C|nr:hypothetical protein [uncultured Methylobacterium sp.]
MSYSTWIIVYPRGDRSKLAVVEIVPALDYEKSDYAIASRREFFGEEDGLTAEQRAAKYARELARNNGLSYEGSNGDHDYLD